MSERSTIHGILDALTTAGLHDGESVLEAIEAAKRYICDVAQRLGIPFPYQGPPGPIPTQEEFFGLLDGLRRWSILHAQVIGASPLQAFRTVELRRLTPVPPIMSGLLLCEGLARREWKQAAGAADNALNDLKTWVQGQTAKPAPDGKEPKADARHSPDFRSVVWYGTPYSFTPMQAACVEVLWKAWENGTPEVSQQYVLEKAGAESQQLKDLFKDHPAWKTMIVPGSTAGACRLSEPQ